MFFIFPPAITELLNRANDLYQKRCSIQELKEGLNNARKFHTLSKGYFLFFNKSRVEHDDVLKFTEAMTEHFANLEKEFARMEDFINTGKIETLIQASMGIQAGSASITETSKALKDLKQNFQVFSPMPVIDDFIKLGINVYNGIFDKKVLPEKLPFILVLKDTIQKDFDRFRELYGEAKELNNQIETSLSSLEQGIGAIYTYTETGEKEDLLNGMKILGVISGELSAQLDKMGDYREDKGHSLNPYLDEFLTYYNKFINGEINREIFQERLKEFKDYYKNVIGEIESFQKDFVVRKSIKNEFLPLIEDNLDEIELLMEDIEENIFNENIDKKTLKNFQKELKAKFHELQENKIEFYEAALKEKDMSEDMMIMNLRDIIKGLYDNIVPVSVLEEHLPAVDKRNEEFLKRVQNILDTGEDYKLDIFEEAFCKRQDLFEELKTYGETKNKKILLTAVEILEDTYDSLKNFEQILGEKEVEKNMISCIKCAHMNPRGQKLCGKCKASLPFSKLDSDESFLEIAEEAETREENNSNDIVKLREMTENVLHNLTHPEELKKFLNEIILKVTNGKKDFKEFISPFLEKHQNNKELKDKANELTLIFENLLEGLATMDKYFSVENKDEYLQNGIKSVEKHEKELEEFREKLQKTLHKYKDELKEK